MKKKSNISPFSKSFFPAGMRESEKEKIIHQLKEDLIMQQEFEKTDNAWKTFDAAPVEKYRDTESAWKNLKERLSHDGLYQNSHKVDRRSVVHLLRIAATILILVAVGAGLAKLFSGRETVKYETVFWNASIAESGVLLPDGSRIFLNEDAEISYPAGFNDIRDVRLKGEAYFEVNHDPSRPFKIYVENTIITVLGTTFNVKDVREENKVEVLVQAGKVRVQAKDDREGMTLLKGQFGISQNGTENLAVQSDLNYLSWKTGKFRFINTSLVQIFETLEKSYHVKINPGNVDLDTLRLTSTYNNQSLDTILETICTAFNISYAYDGHEYILSGR